MSSQQSKRNPMAPQHKARDEMLNVISYDILVNCTLNHGQFCTDPHDCKICGFYEPVLEERKKAIRAKFTH